MTLSGKVRMARLTDLAALGELSRLAQTDAARSLGLPVTRPRMGVFSLFRLPLGAFQPNDLLYVYEEDRRISGLLRVERESHRDEWTMVELDAIGQGDAGDIRFRLVQHLLRDGAKRGAVRFHVACADADGNVELFMQAGFARYGEEQILFRDSTVTLPEAWTDERAASCGIRPVQPLDALALARLYALVTPQPVQRLEAYRLPDWERQGAGWRVPRSSLTPILRFADVEAFVQDQPAGAGRPDRPGGVHPDRRRQGGPAPLPQDPGPARGGRRAPGRVRSGRDRGPDRQSPCSAAWRDLGGSDLRITD